MRTLYIDCGMGAAGDMLTAALLELFPERNAILEMLNQIPGVKVSAEPSVKCGITGTHVSVLVHDVEEDEHLHDHHHHGHAHDHHDHHHHHDHTHDHHEHHHHHDDHEHHHDHTHHHHNGIAEIRRIVEELSVPEQVKADVLAVYNLIAAAESHVHGVPVEQIHFHEVGTMDAIADITAVCLLMHELHPDQIIASPVHVGSGNVRCAHGILPVPAPATAHILRDVPIYGGEIRGELCTPTGAALLKHFVTRFGEMPAMRVHAIGYGMGKKDFERANCVRVMLGETEEQAESVVELSCNLDDMTGEAVGFALEQLMDAGALDVFTIPIGMKKSRPGILFTVLCREADKERFVQLIFRHTTTLGIREKRCERYTLHRTMEAVETPYGTIRKKNAAGYGVSRAKYEYEDLAKAAAERGMGIAELLAELE